MFAFFEDTTSFVYFALFVLFILYRLRQASLPLPSVEGSHVTEVKDNTDWETLLKEKKMVLCDFYATWCPPCRTAAPVFAQMSTEFNENTLSFAKVNVDHARAVAAQCGIKAMPTFILFKAGKEVDRLQGWSKDSIERMLQKQGLERSKSQ
eukprot:c11092_g1_i1.p2 GENE.c11092_g1_i1~~c11092_g1_i1.p2  ORF type:complete len:165 (+),score=38.13 c11092_g1_i1:44-496(+)